MWEADAASRATPPGLASAAAPCASAARARAPDTDPLPAWPALACAPIAEATKKADAATATLSRDGEAPSLDGRTLRLDGRRPSPYGKEKRRGGRPLRRSDGPPRTAPKRRPQIPAHSGRPAHFRRGTCEPPDPRATQSGPSAMSPVRRAMRSRMRANRFDEWDALDMVGSSSLRGRPLPGPFIRPDRQAAPTNQ